ncbi:MAG TPA: beta-N-acetylhexosaminidase [Tepidisphaeraceae bacterium]|jgi:beta-N-acetylhexosaminidase
MKNLTQQIARMFCVGFDAHEPTSHLRDLLAMGVQHVVLFARNVTAPQQIFDLTRQLKSLGDHVMICVDQEGGRVRRLREGFTALPAMRSLGETKDVNLARRAGQALGRELRSVNIDVNFAPCVDVDTNPANPVIAARSFGPDPKLVSEMSCALLVAMQQNSVAACVKHFPGHGDTQLDSHLALPRLNHSMQRLESIELPPFQAAIAAKVASIMTAHVIVETIDAKYPATLSEKVLENMVRRRMNFNGVIFTDDFEMKAIADNYGFEEAIIRGVLAGCDVILVCHTPELQRKGVETLQKAVDSGQISRERIEASSRRIDRLTADYYRAAPEKYTPVSPDEELVDEIDRRSTAIAAGRDPTDFMPRK